jgi:hypothetical protein
MKKLILMVAILIIMPSLASADNVKGYWKDTNHDGIKDTYVQPHVQTHPDSVRTNNYSYPGNYNPNTGHITPQSNSPRETYPVNPNPYDKPKTKNPYGY